MSRITLWWGMAALVCGANLADAEPPKSAKPTLVGDRIVTSEKTILVAHRGASHAAPENTLPAFRLAFDEGADFIEGDYWLTRDGHIVCLHDEDTARTAPNQPNRRVKESTLGELRE